MRTFIALEIPSDFADEAAGVARALSQTVEGRFTAREGYHLTLAFLDDIDDATAARAMDALDAAVASRAEEGAVPLRAEGLGKFGRASDATLWLGIAPDPALTELAAAVRAQLAAHDIPFDERPFRPHLTLARRARLPKGPLPPLAFPAPAASTRLTLFKSTLTPEGALYKPLYEVSLI